MLMLRRILFYFFLIIFVVLCPVVLLYTFGYIFHPQTGFEQTGIIHLSTVPPGATIYLEHSRYTRKTPATIDRLVPGTYRITLDLKGHRTWSRTVAVKPGKASAFNHILLVPNSWPFKVVSSDIFKMIYPLVGTDYCVLGNDKNLASFQIFNSRNETFQPLLEEISELADFPVLSIYHQDSSRSFIVYGGGVWDRKFLHVEIKGDRPVLTDITKLITSVPLMIQWDRESPKDLYAVYANYVDRIDVERSAVFPRFFDDVQGCGFFNNRIFIMSRDKQFLRYSKDKKDPDEILPARRFAQMPLGKNLFYHLDEPGLGADHLMLLSEQGQLLTSYPPYELEPSGVSGMTFNDEDRSLLYWTSSAVKKAELVQDEEGEKFISVDTVMSGREDIRQCFWVGDSRHTVCAATDVLFLVEKDNGEVSYNTDIAKIKSGTRVLYNSKEGIVYFLDPAGQFVRLNLLPQESLMEQLISKAAP